MDRVLVVAPIVENNSLQTQLSEVEASLKSYWHSDLLIGNVSKERLRLALKEPAIGFWYIGHTQIDSGLQLSDGPLAVRLLANYLYRAQIEWSYLNTCYSEQFILRLQSFHPHDILANVGEIADDIAGQNGIMFAQALSQTGDIRKAYRWVADSGNSALRFFPSPTLDQMDNRPDLSKEVARIKQVLFGDHEAGIASFIDGLNSLKSRIARLEIILILLVITLILFGLFTNTTRQRQDDILDYLQRIAPTPTIIYYYPP